MNLILKELQIYKGLFLWSKNLNSVDSVDYRNVCNIFVLSHGQKNNNVHAVMDLSVGQGFVLQYKLKN